MNQYLKHDEWCIIEEGFHPENNLISESVFSIGNGRMGQRANFEEKYSGQSLQGSYIAGVYYPDKTKVGWWKNGYPEYFAKVLNAANWIGIDISVNGTDLDLATCEIENFTRVLDMKNGFLERFFTAKLPGGERVNVTATRFCSLVDDEAGAIRYSVQALNFDGKISVTPYIDYDVVNQDSNYEEKFWEEVSKEITPGQVILTAKTKKLDFQVCTGMVFDIHKNDHPQIAPIKTVEQEKYGANTVFYEVTQGDTLTVYKYAVNLSSENHEKKELVLNAKELLTSIQSKGFDTMLKEQSAAWAQKWSNCDVAIKGDIAAQQGIRFNIFQLLQTYTGEDARLNIGPKGFTGEKYGGSTYWDTEAYCLPFYMSTAGQDVAKKLLVYRHRHLQKAIENAKKLGFNNGAALYPMVTMNGEECHNEWEITFEEIHRNGAIAFAIYDYVRYTGDQQYLADYGLEVLIGISRFWSQRVNYSQAKEKFVMLGVTGPNEYENNVNNNWHTNYIASWCMNYTMEALDLVAGMETERVAELRSQLNFKDEEVASWKDIVKNMYYPIDEKRGIYLQQEGFLDKELIPVDALASADVPICQNWSWDRILRSVYIKQADVLQSMYFFEDQFDTDTIKRNFDFYEPFTVHESSLSPCVHSILAAKIGYKQKAYDFYLRTARLDIDDYNNDTEDGCHITSMAGTWMSIVKGFGGMRVNKGQLHFSPFLPDQWDEYAFHLLFRGRKLRLVVSKEKVLIENNSDHAINLVLFDKSFTIKAQGKLEEEILQLA